MMESYEIVGEGREFGVAIVGGGMLYDLLSAQEASDIASVLNAGTPEDWDAVEDALTRLIIPKILNPTKSCPAESRRFQPEDGK